jgi:hypothetical protein
MSGNLCSMLWKQTEHEIFFELPIKSMSITYYIHVLYYTL